LCERQNGQVMLDSLSLVPSQGSLRIGSSGANLK
ncbi:MAG: hypothetical protein QOD63_3153, partial [Actinomycetota bacterium]|nr:hypothetical protein [Actinomycetota bacterium]